MKRLTPPTWLRSDPSLKFASLVLAVFVWMYVRAEERPLQVFSVPVEYDGLPRNLALAGDVPDSVAVRVRAPDTTLRNLTPSRFHARVRLDGLDAGATEVQIGPEDVRAPLGVEVLRVDPTRLALRLERRISREVPVVARIEGRPALGYEADGYTLTPDRVTVEGPESAVSRLREAVTAEVDITGRRESFEMAVGVTPNRGGARVVGEASAVLRVNIREKRVTREFTGVPLEPSAAAGRTRRVSFLPQTITVVLEGTREALDAIGPANLKAVLDLEGMSPRSAAYAVKPRVVIVPGEIGAGVAVHSVSEPTISVKIAR